jgi:DNA transformation protein
MSVSPSFRAFVVDQLSRVVPQVRARSMFGGVGIYSGRLFFALISSDTLYFKVDDATRGDFERRGMAPFRPFGTRARPMPYYQVPEECLEEPEMLRSWAEKAVLAARRKTAHSSQRRRT